MITNPNAIGAAYEADLHCIAHAEERFGAALYSREGATDNEGNLVSLLFSYSHEGSPEGDYCGDCGSEITAPHS